VPDGRLRAEFTIGNGQDFYDISVIHGFNVPLSLSCSNLMCRADKCPHAYLFPADNSKNHPATTTATRSPSAKETGYLPLFHVIPFVFKVFFH
jgi:hypothetical protein